MPVTEQPVDIVSSQQSGTFVLGNHALRSNWINSFWVPPTANNVNLSPYYNVPFIEYGAVIPNTGFTRDHLGWQDMGGVVNGIEQLYVIDEYELAQVQGNAPPQVTYIDSVVALAVEANSLSPTFPTISLPVAVIVLDGVGRIQQVIDQRPSYLTSVPNFATFVNGSLTLSVAENTSDATKRVNFKNNFAVPRTYALSPRVPQELSLPASGFFLGSGSVLLTTTRPPQFGAATPTPVNFPTTYISNRTTPGLTANAINQGYITVNNVAFNQGTHTATANAALAITTTQTSGVFPANTLPLFEVTCDSVNLIRNLVDWRPSYI